MLFCTDSSHVTQRFGYPFDIVAIECSYDKAVLDRMLKAGDIEEVVARRLLTSHMEKDNAKAYLRNHCNLDRCREIHLLHMSGLNIDKQKTQKEFQAEFFITTLIVGD